MKTYRFLLLCLLAIVVSGCDDDESSQSTSAPAYQEVFEKGPLKLTISLDHQSIDLSQRLELRLVAVLKEGCRLTWPEVKDRLGEFEITDDTEEQPRLVQSHIHAEKYLVLEPFLPGEYEIPALQVLAEGPDAGESHKVTTKPVPIVVRSVLPADEKEPTLRDILPPKNPPPPSLWGWVLGFLLVIALAVFLACWFGRKAGLVQKQVHHVSPQQRAYQALEALLAHKYIDAGEYKLFYLELSMILRHYIEERFGFLAPEQTTEEFLNSIRSSSVLSGEHKQLLRAFLRHCDMVKFAQHHPCENEVDSAFDRAKQFVTETEPCDLNPQ